MAEALKHVWTRYNPEADALYIEFEVDDQKVARTVQFDTGTLVGLNASGQIIGIEVIHPRREWPLQPLAEMQADTMDVLERIAAKYTERSSDEEQRGQYDAAEAEMPDAEAMEETAHLLRSPANAANLTESLAEAQRGEVVPDDHVRREEYIENQRRPD